MDTQTDNSQVDEQELAKALAGVEATNVAVAEADKKGKKVDVKLDGAETAAEAPAATDEIIANATPAPGVIDSVNGLVNATSTTGDAALDAVKTNALQDLKPLVDKLDVTAEEKFVIYQLIFKTADDPSVVEPAYNVAKQITDETKRANALLEVIKEVNSIENPDTVA